MFENYLLNPDAIASVTSQIDGFRDTAITRDEVASWLDSHQWNKDYFRRKIPDSERTDDRWRQRVNGARILEQIFSDLSETRVTYDKVRHGQMLTEWILGNSPGDFQELVALVKECLVENQP